MRNWFIIFTLICSSCIKEIPIKSLGNAPNLPVFHMFIQPDSTIEAHYSHSTDITTAVTDENTGDISVFRNSVFLGQMTAGGNGDYTLGSQTFKSGDSFRIQASDGVTAFTVHGKIPSKVKILSLDTETVLVAGIGPAFNFLLQFHDSAAYENYYRIYVNRYYFKYKFNSAGQIIDSTLQISVLTVAGSELPYIQNNFNNYTSKEILFSDATFNGTSPSLRFYTPDNLYEKKTTRTVKVEFRIENISRELYDYYNTRNAHLWQQQSISQLPGTLQGNIPGGFGVIGGFSYDRKVIGFE